MRESYQHIQSYGMSSMQRERLDWKNIITILLSPSHIKFYVYVNMFEILWFLSVSNSFICSSPCRSVPTWYCWKEIWKYEEKMEIWRFEAVSIWGYIWHWEVWQEGGGGAIALSRSKPSDRPTCLFTQTFRFAQICQKHFWLRSQLF